MKQTERTVAANLLEVEAVKLSPEAPFTWASGWKSPIYCDNRKILSYPEKRKQVSEFIAEIIKERYPDCEIIAGVATGAIAYGVLVADILGKPFVYVRSSAKDHGLGNQVEGVLPPKSKVVVVEDLVSTGMSSLAAVDALCRKEALVEGMVAIFSYNFDKSRKAFEDANVELVTLSNYDALIDVALEKKYIKDSDIDVLKQWRLSPSTWGK